MRLQLLLVLVSLQLEARASALPPRRVALHFTRGDGALGCVDPATLARQVESFTGPVFVAPGDAETAVEAQIVGSAAGFRVHIRLANGEQPASGERVLEHRSPDCHAFDAAIAFVIATMIDPDLTLERVGALFAPSATPPEQALLAELEREPPRPRPPAPTLKEPSDRRLPRRPADTQEDAPPPLRTAIAIGLGSSNELPEAAIGPTFQARREMMRWFELALGVRAVFAISAAEAPTGGAQTSLFSVAPMFCPRLTLGSRVLVRACAGPDLSLLRATGSGFEENNRGIIPIWAALLRPELTLTLSDSYALGVAGFARLTAAKRRLVYEQETDTQVLFVLPRGAFGGDLSVAWTF